VLRRPVEPTARSSHSSLAKFYYWGRGEFAKTRADYEPSHET